MKKIAVTDIYTLFEQISSNYKLYIPADDGISQARFLPDHFVESVNFDRMEVEFIDPDKKKKENPLYF